MSTRYKIERTDELYYLTFQIVGWVDIFTRKIYRDIVIESLRYCQAHKGLNLYAYVIMSNHIHLLAHGGVKNTEMAGRTCLNSQTAVQPPPNVRAATSDERGNIGGLPEYIINPNNVKLTDFLILTP